VSKKKDIWMPIYIGDYLADTGHLTTTQHGAYLLLLMHYWRKRELPADDKQLAAIAKLPLRIWLDSKETIQAFFHDGWKHARVEEELQRRAVVSNKRAEAGAKGGAKARKDEEPDGSNCSDFASDLLKQNESMTQSQSPIAVAVDARERRPLIGPEALALAEQLLALSGHSPAFWPPAWCGAPMRVQTWLSQGWQPEIIVSSVKSVMAKRQGKQVASVQFFENAIAEEHARQAAPLPQVEIREAPTITVTNHGKPKSAVIQAIDDLNQRIADFDDRGGSDELRGAEGEASPRLLSHG
jgi:uncharacterized protein YdaU (DUF1376 family)